MSNFFFSFCYVGRSVNNITERAAALVGAASCSHKPAPQNGPNSAEPLPPFADRIAALEQVNDAYIGLFAVDLSFNETQTVAVLRRITPPADGPLDARVKATTQALADAYAIGIADHPQDWHMLQKLWL